MMEKVFGLDEMIEVAGRKATIREEFRGRRCHLMRGNNGPILGKNPFGHWAVIAGQSFNISEADFKLLHGVSA